MRTVNKKSFKKERRQEKEATLSGGVSNAVTLFEKRDFGQYMNVVNGLSDIDKIILVGEVFKSGNATTPLTLEALEETSKYMDAVN